MEQPNSIHKVQSINNKYLTQNLPCNVVMQEAGPELTKTRMTGWDMPGPVRSFSPQV